jgi:hypothetical protein
LDASLTGHSTYYQNGGFHETGENGGNNNSFTTNDHVQTITMDELLLLTGNAEAGPFESGNNVTKIAVKAVEIINEVKGVKISLPKVTTTNKIKPNYPHPPNIPASDINHLPDSMSRPSNDDPNVVQYYWHDSTRTYREP